MAFFRVANSQQKSTLANRTPRRIHTYHRMRGPPTHVFTPPDDPRDRPTSARGEDSGRGRGLAWGLLRVVQIKCDLPAACFSPGVTILGSGPFQSGNPNIKFAIECSRGKVSVNTKAILETTVPETSFLICRGLGEETPGNRSSSYTFGRLLCRAQVVIHHIRYE